MSNPEGPNPVSRRNFLKTTVAKGTAGLAVAAAGLHPKDAEAVDLTGPAFRARWNGRTLEERFETIRDTMPKGNPNSLGDTTYMDVLAIILQFNDVPPGNQELVPETAKRIVFAPRP